MNRKKVIQIIAGIAIAATGLFLFLRGSDIGELGRQIRNTSWLHLSICVALTMVTMIFRAWRWHVLLPDSATTNKRGLFSHTIIGFMVNNIIPARVGEAVRAVLLWRNNGYSLTTSVGSIVVDRIIDTCIFMLFFALPSLLLPQLSGLRTFGWMVLGLFVVAMTFFVLCSRQPAVIVRLVGMTAVVLPKRFHHRLEVISRDFISVLQWTYVPKKVLLVVISSLGVTLSMAATVLVLAGGAHHLSILHGAFVIAFAVIGSAIPLAPGYVGTQHATILQSFIFLGFEHDAARALAVLLHAVGYIPITLAGFIYFFKADMSFKDIAKVEETIQQ